ncbi:sugar phosphate isomerase/epimerase [Nocardiopsis sp. HNM0947]|uniref:Sugar phosphate isomerase/epimerase n=1 Tax=Nocardiopsis coralli TaxID=2772213 RepID=A0ABR9P0N1_9ACTN|nr:sugar phosphate isomerase/epimerase family protein [Nocardiopsis coralli]MBE2997416.1 sugar phosphate isomerase/epimerase [Nocardiopsis coralli]
MGRPVTLATVQWTDLELPRMCALASEWGFDGLELACHPNHLDVFRYAEEPGYAEEVRALLEFHGLRVYAVSAHMLGQAVCDPVEPRHRAILPDRVWGDGDPDGVRTRAAHAVGLSARAAAGLGAGTVVGFTGSPVWHAFMLFPPLSQAEIDEGYEGFARRWHPVLDEFEETGVRFALEVHPTEVAYDHWTTERTLDAIGHRASFGLNLDPSHFVWQGVDPAAFARHFHERLFHVDLKDVRRNLDGRNGIIGSHLPFGDPRRGWDFVSVGHGEVDFEGLVRSLNAIGYQGPYSVEWEDSGMDRMVGAPDALWRVRELTRITPAQTSFDAAFAT